MVSHSQLQNYKHEYPKVCMTGVLGCRWHRYKQSKNGSNKKDILCFLFLVLASLFVIFWFYSILVIKNDEFTLEEFMYGHMKKWVSWYTILLAVICVLFSYIIILMILSLCHIIQGHQLFIHPVHLVIITVILALCVALTVAVEDLWIEEFDVVYLSLQMFGPFLQIGAVCFLTLLSWSISQEWNRISTFSWRVVYLCVYVSVLVGLYISPLFIQCPCILLSENLPEKPKLIAHRGDMSMAPENTVISFKKAVTYEQVAGFELDVMISAGDVDGSNGTLFLMHDTSLERTTNIAHVYPHLVDVHPSSLNISQLRNLNAGEWFLKDDPFGTVSGLSSGEKDLIKKERIPLFSEVLEVAKNNSKFILFDIFRPPPGHIHYNDTVTQVVQTIRDSGIDPSLIFWLGYDESLNDEKYTFLYGGMQDSTFLLENNYTGINLLNGAAHIDQLRDFRSENVSTLIYMVNTAWLYSYYWCLGVTYTHTDYLRDMHQLDAPIWHLAPDVYRALWITVDVISTISVITVFVVNRCRLNRNKYGPEQVSLNSNSTGNSWGKRHSRRSMKEKLILKDVPSNIYDFEPDDDFGISSNGYDATVTLEDGRVLAQAFRASYHSNMSENNSINGTQAFRASYHSNMSEGNSINGTQDENRSSYIEEVPSENGDTYHSNRSSFHGNMHQTEAEIA